MDNQQNNNMPLNNGYQSQNNNQSNNSNNLIVIVLVIVAIVVIVFLISKSMGGNTNNSYNNGNSGTNINDNYNNNNNSSSNNNGEPVWTTNFSSIASGLRNNINEYSKYNNKTIKVTDIKVSCSFGDCGLGTVNEHLNCDNKDSLNLTDGGNVNIIGTLKNTDCQGDLNNGQCSGFVIIRMKECRVER